MLPKGPLPLNHMLLHAQRIKVKELKSINAASYVESIQSIATLLPTNVVTQLSPNAAHLRHQLLLIYNPSIWFHKLREFCYWRLLVVPSSFGIIQQQKTLFYAADLKSKHLAIKTKLYSFFYTVVVIHKTKSVVDVMLYSFQCRISRVKVWCGISILS